MRIVALVAALAAVLAASARADVLGQQRLALVLVTWGPQPVTVEEARTAVAQTDAFIREASFGRTWLSVDVIGWRRAHPARPVGCDTQGIDATVRRSVNLDAYTKVAYLLPEIDCPWGGAYYAPGVWMLGRITKQLFAHELGHTYGVTEEGPAWICDGSHCEVRDYGNPYSVMGHGEGHFNAYEKWTFGWIERAGPFVATGDVEIARIDRPSAQPHALYVVAGPDEYWIEYRPEARGPVVHAGPHTAHFEPGRFDRKNVLLAHGVAPSFAVRGAFDVRLARSDDERAILRFRWTDRTRPARPRLTAAVAGRRVALSFPARDAGSGVDRYEVSVNGKRRTTVRTLVVLGRLLGGREPEAELRLPHGTHRISVVAVDRAGNRSPVAARAVRVR